MEEVPLSFNPDRRSYQGSFYHVSTRPSYREYTLQDSISGNLRKLFQAKFRHLSPDYQETLIDTIVRYIPLAHKNLLMIAVAVYVIYQIQGDLTPKTFDQQFKKVRSILMSDTSRKKAEEIKELEANFKVTLLRYIFYVLGQLEKKQE